MKYIYFVVFLSLVALELLPAGEASAQLALTKRKEIEQYQQRRPRGYIPRWRGKTSGFYNLTELTIGFGLQGYSQLAYRPHNTKVACASISTMVGFWFTPSFTAGLGIGLMTYNYTNTVPAFLEAGYYFNEFGLSILRPFIKVDGGILYRLNGNIAQVRTFANPTAGLLIPVKNHLKLSVAAGYMTQWQSKSQAENFVTARVGLIFY